MGDISQFHFSPSEQLGQVAGKDLAENARKLMDGVYRILEEYGQKCEAKEIGRVARATLKNLYVIGKAPSFVYLTLGYALSRVKYNSLTFLPAPLISVPLFQAIKDICDLQCAHDVDDLPFTCEMTGHRGAATFVHIEFTGQLRQMQITADSYLTIKVKNPKEFNVPDNLASFSTQLLYVFEMYAERCANVLIVSVVGNKALVCLIGLLLSRSSLKGRRIKIPIACGSQYLLCPLVTAPAVSHRRDEAVVVKTSGCMPGSSSASAMGNVQEDDTCTFSWDSGPCRKRSSRDTPDVMDHEVYETAPHALPAKPSAAMQVFAGKLVQGATLEGEDGSEERESLLYGRDPHNEEEEMTEGEDEMDERGSADEEREEEDEEEEEDGDCTEEAFLE
jgi:hypothetical protein